MLKVTVTHRQNSHRWVLLQYLESSITFKRKLAYKAKKRKQKVSGHVLCVAMETKEHCNKVVSCFLNQNFCYYDA